MKRFLSLLGNWAIALLFTLGLASPAAQAQVPRWQSASLFTAATSVNGNSIVRATTSDAQGNIYVAGEFIGIVSFGAVTLNSGGNQAAFVAKWNAVSNSYEWAQQADGYVCTVNVAAIAVSGNAVYLAGSFTGTGVSFGGIMPGGASTSREAFVAKLVETNGTASFVWVKQSTGAGDEKATGLAVQGTTAYLTGVYGGAGITGPATFDNTTLANAGTGTTDIFVAKLTDSGSAAAFNWALRVGGSHNDEAYTIAVNGVSVYLGGHVTGPVPFGSIPTYASSGQQTCFLAKLTDAGSSATFTWVQLPQGYVDIFSLAVNGNTVYAAGEFDYWPTFGSVKLYTAGVLDGFVVKLTDAGSTSSFVWGYRFGNGYSNYDGARALAVSGRTLYVAGYKQPSVFLGCLTDLGASARENWTKTSQSNSGGNDYAYAVALGARGTVHIAGAAHVPITFDAIRFGSQGYYLTSGFHATLTDPLLTTATAARPSFRFGLAPSPARASTSVQLPALPGPATLTLLDDLGRVVRTRPAQAGTRTEFDLGGLPPGLYLLRATIGAATATQRLVVE